MSEVGNLNTALSIQHEAVSIYRDLASANPIRYRQDLDIAASGEAWILRELGRESEASKLLAEVRRTES